MEFRKKDRAGVLWCCFLAAVVALGLPTFGISAEPTITIGYLIDLSAKAAFIGEQSRAGAELAIRELSKEGVNVRVVYEDHRTEPRLSVTAARKLIDIDRVDGLLCDTTPACVAASPVAAGAGRPFLYQSPAVSILQSNPYAFKNFMDYEEGCRRVAASWQREGVVSILNLRINAEFGELCHRGSETVFEQQIENSFDSGTDLRSFIARAKAEGVQGIVQTGYESDYISSLRAASELGFAVRLGMPKPVLTEAVVNSVPARVLDGVTVFAFQEIEPRFVTELKAAGLYRGENNLHSAAIAYQHVRVLTAAVRACGRDKSDCMVRQIARSNESRIGGFRGFAGRIARYEYDLYRMRNGAPERVEE